MKLKILFIILVLFSFYSYGQPKKQGFLFENYIISLKFGTSSVLTEYKRNLSGIINEMNHKPGYSYEVGISKLISSNWEVGYQYGYSYFHGFQDNPDFSAYRFGHYKISLMRIEPVIYRSNIKNHNIVATYKFNNNPENKLIPFVSFTAGLSKLTSELMYASTHELIFGKVGWNEDKRNVSDFIINFNIGVGAGVEWMIHPKLSVSLIADITNLNDDNLDGVHNFYAPPPEGYNNKVSGIYGKALVGLRYYINPNRQRFLSENEKLINSSKKRLSRSIFF